MTYRLSISGKQNRSIQHNINNFNINYLHNYINTLEKKGIKF